MNERTNTHEVVHLTLSTAYGVDVVVVVVVAVVAVVVVVVVVVVVRVDTAYICLTHLILITG